MRAPTISGRQAATACVVAGLLCVLMAVRFVDTPAAIPAYCVFMVVLVVQTWIDLRTRRLPREITNIGLGLGGVLLSVAAIVGGEPERIAMAVLGAAMALVALGAIHRVGGGRFGEGDVRFAPLIGLHLGWLAPAVVVIGLFSAFVAGSIVGVVLLVGRRATMHTMVAFGPFLSFGAVAGIVVGQPFVDLVSVR